MKLFLPNRVLPALLFFCVLGLIFHFLPTLGVPSPDVISYYRLWAAPSDNIQLMAALPPKWHQTHNLPSDPLSLFINGWYPFTERFDFLTIAYFWGMARLFGDNGDVWRLAGTLSVSLAIGFFYLIAIKLRVSRVLAWFLSLSLFFTPIGWLRGIEAEIRAVFFLMMALYLALSSGRWRNSILSSLAMLGAVLTKETFVGAWILIPVMIVYREWADPNAPRLSVLPKLVKQLTPHIVAATLIMVFVIFLRLRIPVLVSYVFQSNAKTLPFLEFSLNYLYALQSDLIFGDLFSWNRIGLLRIGFLLAVIAFICFLNRSGFSRWFKTWDSRFVLVVAGLVIATILHAVPFYLTARSIQGRYVAPAIFYAALLIGLITTPFFRMMIAVFREHLSPYFYRFIALREVYTIASNGLLLILTGIAVAGPLDAILVESMQYRTDMQAWQALNDMVIETAPHGAHIVASFPSASMGETAALLINILLDGRYDLVYHFGDFPEANCLKMPENCLSYAEFNELQPPLPQDTNATIMYVNISREGESSWYTQSTSLLEMLKHFIISPAGFWRTRYGEGYKPYIEYSISIQS